MDGALQSSILDFDINPDYATKLFVTNYRDGMTGSHIFRGAWWIDGLLIEEDPGEAYLSLVCVLEVTFV